MTAAIDLEQTAEHIQVNAMSMRIALVNVLIINERQVNAYSIVYISHQR